MGFFSIFRKKKHTFEDPEVAKAASERAAEINALKHEKRILERQRNIMREQFEIRKLQDQINFYGAPPQEAAPGWQGQIQELMGLFALIQGIQGKGNNQEAGDMAQFMASLQDKTLFETTIPGSPDLQNPRTDGVSDLSDAEIRENLKSIPADKIALAKRVPASMIKSYIKKRFDYSDQTINRAIEILKKEM